MPNDVNPATITFHIAFDKGDFFIDGVRFYVGEYTPGTPTAVQPKSKLAVTWGSMKAN